MSHPDPLFDSDNSYEDDNVDYNFDDVSDFYGDENTADYNDDMELDDNEDEYDNFENYYDDSMDGDHDSGMTSAGWGTDEDYGYYGEDY